MALLISTLSISLENEWIYWYRWDILNCLKNGNERPSDAVTMNQPPAPEN